MEENPSKYLSINLEFSGESSSLCTSAMSYAKRRNFTRDDLKCVGNNIPKITRWDDPVDRLSVHAHIAKSQHEALIEEKQRRDENNERPSKRTTRGEKARQQKNPIHEETLEKISTKERKLEKEKNKGSCL